MPLDVEKIKALRAKSGMSQEAAATLAGLSRVALARLETGARSDPPISTLEGLAAAYGVEPGSLLADVTTEDSDG